MRMWMVEPKIMCRKHLLGEHVELHMLVGCIKREKSLCGFVENKLIEPTSIFLRHIQLSTEMLLRGYDHNSEISPWEYNKQLSAKYSDDIFYATVNRVKSLNELLNRCPECRRRAK